MKKKSILMACSLGLVMMASSAFAASGWDTCKIKEIGVAGTATQLLRVTSCKGSSSYAAGANNDKYLGIALQQDTTMAVSLTALATSKYVKIYANFGAANTSSVATNVQTLNLAD